MLRLPISSVRDFILRQTALGPFNQHNLLKSRDNMMREQLGLIIYFTFVSTINRCGIDL